ncbi:hypothetical protein KP509_18G037700 [Ceratopteris richardii]|uniref:BHLH domain-containing protein n=1 Tax=Ceratopteris richardii TaxID=49495 RepID=A0A8T2SNV4_CERRI|nr:hypothetical protein KP509_18G037700 [Ceratopteris richardii]
MEDMKSIARTTFDASLRPKLHLSETNSNFHYQQRRHSSPHGLICQSSSQLDNFAMHDDVVLQLSDIEPYHRRSLLKLHSIGTPLSPGAISPTEDDGLTVAHFLHHDPDCISYNEHEISHDPQSTGPSLYASQVHCIGSNGHESLLYLPHNLPEASHYRMSENFVSGVNGPFVKDTCDEGRYTRLVADEGRKSASTRCSASPKLIRDANGSLTSVSCSSSSSRSSIVLDPQRERRYGTIDQEMKAYLPFEASNDNLLQSIDIKHRVAVPMRINTTTSSGSQRKGWSHSAQGLSTTLRYSLSSEQNKKRRKRKRVSQKNFEEMEPQRMTHIAVERNRRKQMNDHLRALRLLMPESYIQRGDQASIIGGTIRFIKELEEVMDYLLQQKRLKDTSINNNTIRSIGNMSNAIKEEDEHSTTTFEVPKVDVNMVAANNIQVKISTHRKEHQLLQIISEFAKHYMTIKSMDISSMGRNVHYSFQIEEIIED